MKSYDVIVIGAGPGGMTAAMYAARAGLTVGMLDRGVYGGQMNVTDKIENYPGYSSIAGPELGEKMYQTAANSGVKFIYGDVNQVSIDDQQVKHIQTTEEEFISKAVVIATGSTNRKLNVSGEAEFTGKGVSYCAVCDGAFFRNQDVTVIGGGDSAVSESLYLTNLTDHVNLVHRRDQLKAQKVLQDRAFNDNNLDLTWHSEVTEIIGDNNHVTGVKLRNKQTNQEQVASTSGVFIYVGNVPNTQVFANLKITDQNGWIVTDEELETAIPGIFAVGDVRQKKLRQITTAIGDGAIAGQNVFEYVSQLEPKVTE